MKFTADNPLVYTIKDKCRVCYTCVRSCPAKAIKVEGGQAYVIVERCIGCGNCVKVCSQGAKVYYKSLGDVVVMLESGKKAIACIAPSFPAEFAEIPDYKVFVGMLRSLGFSKVVEVGFGADLVAFKYKELFERKDKHYITSDCPAVMFFVRQYYPGLTENLAPVDSPAMAIAKVVREKYGDDYSLVFIGPCIAKKAESELFDHVMTFAELRQLFDIYGVKPENALPSDFDEPKAGRGAIFPVSSGLLQTINRPLSFDNNGIVVADGHKYFKEAIKEFAEGTLSDFHLELLACEGCINGAGFTNKDSIYKKKNRIAEYVRQKLENLDTEKWNENFEKYSKLDLTRTFEPMDRRLPLPSEDEIQAVLRRMGKLTKNDYLDCGACGYDTCREHAIAVAQGLAEPETCLPYTIEKLHQSIRELEDTRQALVQSEKLASMGQLSAGIAHELNNPLGVITLYANILKDETDKNSQLYSDLETIAEQAERCKKIVGGLLNFARKQQVNLRQTDLYEFVCSAIKGIVIPDNVDVTVHNNLSDRMVWIDCDQMQQVVLNLVKNAIEAMPQGGKVEILLYDQDEDKVVIEVKDNGTGIAPENLDRIFTPFFTTKEQGKGTGLGLPLVYGIIKMHKGQIFVKSNNDPRKGDTGTTFVIKLPRNPKNI